MDQVVISLSPKPRGIHIITDEIVDYLPSLPETGILHLFIQHTSASICINESADPTVLQDMNEWFNQNIQENEPYYKHVFEGPDDMPAHIKSVLMGTEVSVPISNGRLALGSWQGVYLGEFRNHAGNRKIVATVLS